MIPTKRALLSGLAICTLGLERLHEAAALLWECMYGKQKPDLSDPVERSFADFIAFDALYERCCSGELRLLGALYEGELIGLLAVRYASHISLYFVRPALCGMGVGRALFDEFIRRAAADGVQRITLNASESGRAVYEHYGFVRDRTALPQSPRTVPMQLLL